MKSSCLSEETVENSTRGQLELCRLGRRYLVGGFCNGTSIYTETSQWLLMHRYMT